MEFENRKIINVILVGSTGSGKSTTGNSLYGEAFDKPFTVGDEAVSCTFLAEKHVNNAKKIQIIDTPGFGDNRFHDKEIDKIIRDLTIALTDPRVESSGVIDAFILPVKLYPRPATLKTDLEHFMDIFGTVALKSLIILPIYMDAKQRTEADAWKDFSRMGEILKILKTQEGRQVNESWICLWDNVAHKPNQEEKLLEKIAKMEPYTHKKFLEAAQDIQKRLDARVQEEINRLVDLAQKDLADDKEKMEKRINEIQTKAEQEKLELRAAQERAQNDTTKFLEAMQQMSADSNRQVAKLFDQLTAERELNNERMRKLTEDMNENNHRQIQEMMAQNTQQTTALQNQIVALSQQKQQQPDVIPEPSSASCNIF